MGKKKKRPCIVHAQIRPSLHQRFEQAVQRGKDKGEDISKRSVVEKALEMYLASIEPPPPDLVAAGLAHKTRQDYLESLPGVLSGETTLQSLADSMASPWIEIPPDDKNPGTVYFPKVPGTTPKYPPEHYGHPFGRKIASETRECPVCADPID